MSAISSRSKSLGISADILSQLDNCFRSPKTNAIPLQLLSQKKARGSVSAGFPGDCDTSAFTGFPLWKMPPLTTFCSRSEREGGWRRTHQLQRKMASLTKYDRLPESVMVSSIWVKKNAASQSKSKSGHKSKHMSSLNDLEFAYAPVRDQTRDLREYL